VEKFTMRIIAGKMKGRLIPFDNRTYSSAETTSQKLKKAAFSMMGEWLNSLRFLDLFACSGQIGFEACSRGAAVVMVEKDPHRFAFVRDLTREWSCGGSIRALRGDAMDLLESPDFQQQEGFDIIYMDPPYDAMFNDKPLCLAALESCSAVLKSDGMVLIQHPVSLQMPPSAGQLQLRKTRVYGKSALSCFEFPGHEHDDRDSEPQGFDSDPMPGEVLL